MVEYPMEQNNMSMLYYGFFVVATVAIILSIYHCIVIKLCSNQSWPGPDLPATIQISEGQKTVAFASTLYKFEKGDEAAADDDECVVCLSIYEDGEEIRELPKCRHSFHAPCIDMWLHSHFDCPLCRAPIGKASEDLPQSENDSVIIILSE